MSAATTPKLTKTDSAATAGSKDIVVKLTEDLDLDTGNTLEGFTVKVNDASVDVKTVKYTDDSKITITLEEAAIDLDATMFVKVIYDGSDETAVNADGVALEDGYIQFSVSAAAEG